MSSSIAFSDVARLAAARDNVAIATRRLEAGTRVRLSDGEVVLPHTVLEGHRFAIRTITTGESLLSWGLPFGRATAPIAPGDYVCNESMLQTLAVRQIAGASLPAAANFADDLKPFVLGEAAVQPGADPELVAAPRTFQGYRRPGGRGVGTRNYVVILGTTSRTASFARQLAARLQPLARVHPGIDGIVAIAHTEGGGPATPNNAAEVLRALAGFIVHPNVAAVLAVDYGVEPITNARLREFMGEHAYPLDDVPHAFLTLAHGLAAGLVEGERIVRGWLPAANAQVRTPESLRGLRIALQCGGSDAFSGISGNPLAGAVVHEVIRHGGTGVLTETDEAFGAESYLVQNVRDLSTARAFVRKIDSFRERLRWHGVTAESNPSGGNKLRGLYNIALKSLGAVHKKDPRTRLDHVSDYAEPLDAPGFYFMNGPGNDLEGIAGQVAAGCNLIVFVTGNGSITNFPFVPTLKITTTTRRHQLLVHEMDINAGRYLDGEAMEALVTESLELSIETASGRKTKGEHAGHAQVSLWRDWRQTDTSQLERLRTRPAPRGEPLPLLGTNAVPEQAATPLRLFATPDGRFATERVGLVLPTSLCASQIARLAAERLNANQLGTSREISRFVALPHTEGCGFGGQSMHELLHRTYRGYVTHPNVAAALLLEHGCEKVPNDVMRHQLELAAVETAQFGWASVQLDGGIEKALAKIEAWFREHLPTLPVTEIRDTTVGALGVAIVTSAPVAPITAVALGAVTRLVVAHGGSVFIPESDALLAHDSFRASTLGATAPSATLAYGQPSLLPGFHVVATETDHWTENLTGLAACGAHLALAVVHDHARQGHPLLPVIQIAEPFRTAAVPAVDIDVQLAGDNVADTATLLRTIAAVAERKLLPAAQAQGFVDFQLTRGLLGVST